MKAILESALSLTLSDYIQAVVSLCPVVAPISNEDEMVVMNYALRILDKKECAV